MDARGLKCKFQLEDDLSVTGLLKKNAIVLILGALSTLTLGQTSTAQGTAATPLASSSIPAERLAQYADLAVEWERAYLQVNTSNPPGNETKAVEYLKKVLEAEGIPTKTLALDPARANLVARLKGNGSKRPLLILAHTDVKGPGGEPVSPDVIRKMNEIGVVARQRIVPDVFVEKHSMAEQEVAKRHRADKQ